MNDYAIIIVSLILSVVLLSGYYIYYNYFNNKTTTIIDNHPLNKDNNKNIELVVSRYNEDLKWTNVKPFSKYPVVCYNKGTNDNYNVNYLKQDIKLSNVGRESHTYLYHIINNYDNLAEITVFLPGSVNTNVYNKWKRANMLMNKLDSHNSSIFIGAEHDNVRDELYDFKMDDYNSTNPSNNTLNPETKLQLSSIRPYGLWYDKHFSGIDVTYISYSGIFALSREHILQNPKSYYENLIHELSMSSNPEAGHYFERSWVAIFYPTPNALFINTNHLF